MNSPENPVCCSNLIEIQIEIRFKKISNYVHLITFKKLMVLKPKSDKDRQIDCRTEI